MNETKISNGVHGEVDYVSIYDDTAVENSIDPIGNEVDVEIPSTSWNMGVIYKF